MLGVSYTRLRAWLAGVVAGGHTVLAVAAAIFVTMAALDPAQAQALPGRRVALVIGNATYTNGGVLDNPEADVDLIAGKLSSLGFQVTADKNLGQSGMRDLIGGFMSRVRDGDLVLIYYAGHGIEGADGRDYMLPVDVKLDTPAAVQFQGIPLDMLYSDRKTFGVIIVFDACRDNPFIRKVKGAVAGTHALSPPVGALVLFSASAGDVAEDGGLDASGQPRRNSAFATALNNALSVADAPVERIYQMLLREVRTQTTNGQAPQRYGALAEDFTFNPSGRLYYAAPQPRPSPPPPAPVQVATGPPGTLYRSVPTSDLGNTTPPAQVAPAPPLATANTAAVEVAASPPPPETQVSPPPGSQVLAAASLPPSLQPAALTAPAGGPATFTIASLGENVMPSPPQLSAVPAVELPVRFCSVEEQIDYLNKTFKPAYETAYRNNEVAISYLSALNALGAEYNSRQSGFVFQIKRQFDAFAPVAAQAHQTSTDVLSLDAKIRRIPVESCPGRG